MARLTAEQWEKARAEYEVSGKSLGEIARAFAVNVSSISRKAKAEQWQQGKMQGLVQRKVAAIKEIVDIETQKQGQPLHLQVAIDEAAKEQLTLEGIRQTFHHALYAKGMELLAGVDKPADWKTLTSGARDLMPQEKAQTTVNVQQAQGQAIMSPRDALAEILEQGE